MIADIIVISSIVFGVAFFGAWLVRPDLRAWIERPKYRFQANLRQYDRDRSEEPSSDGSPST